MVGQYKKVNQMTKCHAAFLPNMECMIEKMASCKWKSKMDLRSGFWQVGMSEKAKDLTAFTTPSGRCFRWNCMPFGLQGAPGVFQEMMEQVCAKTKAKLPDKLKNGFLGAFFDDAGLGTQTEDEHLQVLEELLKTAQENHLRIKLSKCDFLQQNLEYLGYEIGFGHWKPNSKKVEALLKEDVKTLKDLRSFLGACNFYRRHIPNFTYSSAILTDLTKKDSKFQWGPMEKEKFQELRSKLASVSELGVPRSTGEILLVTDASDVGGGASIFQWQSLHTEEIPVNFATTGVKPDGTFKHDYPDNFRLVPLGHWNWKWNPARSNYKTFEKELLAGVLTIASQSRILSNLPIVWFCDHEALKTFLDKEPPQVPRLKRWYCFLSQFCLKFVHLPGVKNELTDWLSRATFENKYNLDLETLAKDAFERMDEQLDLRLSAEILTLQAFPDTTIDYAQTEFKEIWEQLEQWKSTVIDNSCWYKTDKHLFRERKLTIPKALLPQISKRLHQINGHPGPDRTTWFFLKQFFVDMTRQELFQTIKNVLMPCEVCAKAKPNTARDRGLVGALPIPQLSNDILYIDFVAMDEFNNQDYVLAIVDGLTRFVQYIPCHKSITGEKTLKLILKEWIQKFDKPTEILSDNDVRFQQEKGFYQSAFRSLGIDVRFSIPRHPGSNGLCERENRSFIQNMRCLALELKTKDWPKLVPYCVWLMNSQLSGQTGLSPAELFLGRPSWKFDVLPEPATNPTVNSWLLDQMEMQEAVIKRLETIRRKTLSRANKRRVPAKYEVGDMVLVHKQRFPQRHVPKLESPWLGPYKVVQVRHSALKVMVSPHLGGVVDVAFQHLKRWLSVVNPEIDDDNDETIAREDEEVQLSTDETQNGNAEQIPNAQIPEIEEFSEKKANDMGFYNVEKILKHKYQQGWRFLTQWEGFPVSSATWEPARSFKLPDNRLNSVFERYCREQNLPTTITTTVKRRASFEE